MTDDRKFTVVPLTPELRERVRWLWDARQGEPLQEVAVAVVRLAEIERRLGALECEQELMNDKLEVLKALVLDLVKVLTEMREAVCGGEGEGGGDGGP